MSHNNSASRRATEAQDTAPQSVNNQSRSLLFFGNDQDILRSSDEKTNVNGVVQVHVKDHFDSKDTGNFHSEQKMNDAFTNPNGNHRGISDTSTTTTATTINGWGSNNIIHQGFLPSANEITNLKIQGSGINFANSNNNMIFSNTSKNGDENDHPEPSLPHYHFQGRSGAQMQFHHPSQLQSQLQFFNHIENSNGHERSTGTLDSFALSKSQNDYLGQFNLPTSMKESSVLKPPAKKKSKIVTSSQQSKKKQNGERDGRDSQWMMQYDALKAFHQEFGHANVPMHFQNNKRLGHWINNQRQLYRKFKAGMPSSMTAKRIELLEQLDFAWVLGKDWKHKRGRPPKKVVHDIEDGLQEVDSQSNGDSHQLKPQCLNLPNDEVGSYCIGEIEAKVPLRKRHNYHEIQMKVHHDELSNASPHDNIINDKVDMNQPSEMNAEDATNRHVESVTGTPKSPPTYQKVVSQDDDSPPVIQSSSSSSISDYTAMHGKMCSEKDDDPTTFNIPKINIVHTIQTQNSQDAYNVQNMKSSELQWHKHIKDLIDFKEMFGHCNVPFQYNENKSLGYWVHNMRQVYKKWLKGEPCSLTQSRIESLLELGFNLKSPRLLKKENGTVNKSNERIDDPTSSDISECADQLPSEQVVIVQQPERKDETKSLPHEALPAAAKHDAPLTFPIANDSTKAVKTDAFDTLWNRRLLELSDFYEIHGHCDVPASYLQNK